jgi:phosphoribosylamine--glycine ligase
MPSLSDDDVEVIVGLIIKPTLEELRRRGLEFRGVLYAGVILTESGPKLLEYNVRFGDPEAQVLVPLYGDNLYDVLVQCAEGRLEEDTLNASGAAVTVVLAAEGYPQRPRKGDVISGIGDDGQLDPPHGDVIVFHAATLRNLEGRFITRGGRVLAVTGFGPSVAEARRRAYDGAAAISFKGSIRRSDIALAASERAS